GNTNTVFSIWDGKQFLSTWRTSTEWQRTADQYFVWLSTLMKAEALDVVINEVIISSTVPRVEFNLRLLCDRYFNCRPLVVGKPDCLLPTNPRVDAGTQVGPDRLVNAAGAFERHGGDLIVVDFGTATTFDVVAEDGAYVGGAIAPGVNLSLEALHHAAAALPHVDITRPRSVIGTNTVHCMQSGVFWGYVGLVRGISARIRDEYARPMTVIGTGGLAPLFGHAEVLFDAIEDDLTMHGLTVIHRYNKEKT
ncbi:MAG: type III pantothenate kinase, partial [Paracoccaceae bacterium]